MPLKRCLVLGALAATLLAVPAPASAADSSTCQPAIIEGTFGGQRLRLAVDSPSTGTARVCFRVGNTAGGAITIGGGGGSIGVPSTDGNDTACTTTAGNSAPGPHPLADGAVAGQRVFLDLYRGNGQVWVCVGLGAQRFRVIIPVPGVSLPGVTYEPDPDIGGLPQTCDVAPQACEPTPEPCEVAPRACEPLPGTCDVVPQACEPLPTRCELVPQSCEPLPEPCEVAPRACEPPPDPDPIYIPSVCEQLGGCTFTCDTPTACLVVRVIATVLDTPIYVDP